MEGTCSLLYPITLFSEFVFNTFLGWLNLVASDFCYVYQSWVECMRYYEEVEIRSFIAYWQGLLKIILLSLVF